MKKRLEINGNPMSLTAEELGRRIIEINRKIRLGDTTMAEWANRIKSMLQAQPDLHEPIAVRNVRPPEGGAGSSSGTLFFEADISMGGKSITNRYVLRFKPMEQLFHDYDIGGQVRIQRALAETDVPVVPQCWEDISGHHLGVSGYIMEFGKGVAAPASWCTEGIIAEAAPALRRRLVTSFIATLAKIHAVDWRRKGLSFLLERAKGEGLIAREINWYWDGLDWAGEHEAMERFAPIRQWLLSNQPPFDRAVLCHGDANLTNNLFNEGEVSAVLDWEMAFIGTPECDIAYAVMGMGSLTDDFPEGVPGPDEMIAEYERVSGCTLCHMPYYRLFSNYHNVLTHILGIRAFPPDFQAAFAAYVERQVERMMIQAREVGAA